MRECGEQVAVAAQLAVEFEVGGRALGLDVDEELERCAVTPVHGAVVGPDAGCQRFQVERREGALRVEVDRVMGDEELTFDEVDVRLDAGEAVVEGVEERPGVLVVVVRVGAQQGSGAASPLGRLRVPGHGDGRGDRRGEGGEGSAAGEVGHAFLPGSAVRGLSEYEVP